jgi:hypothetical protein
MVDNANTVSPLHSINAYDSTDLKSSSYFKAVKKPGKKVTTKPTTKRTSRT